MHFFFLSVYVEDKFYGRSKFGQYDKEKNPAPSEMFMSHVAKFYGLLILTRSGLRASTFAVLKLT